MNNPKLIEVNPRTGIDDDIMHKYGVLGIRYFINGMQGVRKLLQENPDRTYETHYQGIDESILANHNQARIKMLNDLSVEAYETLVLGNGAAEDLIEIIRKAFRIIRGRELENSYVMETFPGINFQLQFEYEY